MSCYTCTRPLACGTTFNAIMTTCTSSHCALTLYPLPIPSVMFYPHPVLYSCMHSPSRSCIKPTSHSTHSSVHTMPSLSICHSPIHSLVPHTCRLKIKVTWGDGWEDEFTELSHFSDYFQPSASGGTCVSVAR